MAKDLSASEAKVYMYLQGLQSSDTNYIEFESVEQLAESQDISIQSVYLALKMLDAKSLIHVFYKGRTGAKQSIKIYMFNQNNDSFSELADLLQTASMAVQSLQKMTSDIRRKSELLQLEVKEKDVKIASFEKKLEISKVLEKYLNDKGDE